MRRRQILTTWIFNFELCLGIDRCELRADDKWQDKVINTSALIWDPVIYEQFAVSSATWQHSDRFVLFLCLTGSKSIILGNSLICFSSNEAYYRAKSQPYFGCQAYAWFNTFLYCLSWIREHALICNLPVQPLPQWIHGRHQDLNTFQLFAAHWPTPKTLLIFQSCLGSLLQKPLIVKLYIYSIAGKSHLSGFFGAGLAGMPLSFWASIGVQHWHQLS